MTTSAITKTIKKVEKLPTTYSLGFRRLSSLPLRVRKNINTTCVLKGEKSDKSFQDYLNRLSDDEFKNWLKTV